jgi:cytochrome bd-type quinol oxidase subunit 2
MSSPGARQRRRREQYQAPRTRRELSIAIGVAAGIVGGSALMIWLLRPGGLADRQPRSSWLVALSLIAAIAAVWTILRRAEDRGINLPLWLGGSLAGILVVAIVVGIVWPSGLLRHTPPAITVPAETTTQPTATTAAGATTTTKPGTSTSATGATTTTPATTAAPTSTSP